MSGNWARHSCTALEWWTLQPNREGTNSRHGMCWRTWACGDASWASMRLYYKVDPWDGVAEREMDDEDQL